ncbi:hypothetical protein BB559_004841 [Furculomyces boomerangus]|uniref:Uncharacterized protein n=1 Tax=Furculomyces boomerangus TaxID=61424 RepID=A0A2T9YCB8_9FUNG|nr:hypothetical protein BB559_004841 [Furculomyces boomerangus]
MKTFESSVYGVASSIARVAVGVLALITTFAPVNANGDFAEHRIKGTIVWYPEYKNNNFYLYINRNGDQIANGWYGYELVDGKCGKQCMYKTNLPGSVFSMDKNGYTLTFQGNYFYSKEFTPAKTHFPTNDKMIHESDFFITSFDDKYMIEGK